MIITAIDPGLSGGIATLDPDGVSAIAMPHITLTQSKIAAKAKGKGRNKTATREELDLKAIARELEGTDLLVIELATAFSATGEAQGGKSSFSTGRRYGEILGIASALGIPVEQVYSQSWKKVVLPHVNTKGLTREEARKLWKQEAIAFCCTHYPHVELVPPRCRNPHDGIADAVCILEWAKRKFLVQQEAA